MLLELVTGRPAPYAFRYADKAQLWQPEREVIVQLKQLIGLRKRLLNAKNAHRVPLRELAGIQDKKLVKNLEKLNRKPVEALEKQLSEVCLLCGCIAL